MAYYESLGRFSSPSVRFRGWPSTSPGKRLPLHPKAAPCYQIKQTQLLSIQREGDGLDLIAMPFERLPESATFLAEFLPTILRTVATDRAGSIARHPLALPSSPRPPPLGSQSRPTCDRESSGGRWGGIFSCSSTRAAIWLWILAHSTTIHGSAQKCRMIF